MLEQQLEAIESRLAIVVDGPDLVGTEFQGPVEPERVSAGRPEVVTRLDHLCTFDVAEHVAGLDVVVDHEDPVHSATLLTQRSDASTERLLSAKRDDDREDDGIRHARVRASTCWAAARARGAFGSGGWSVCSACPRASVATDAPTEGSCDARARDRPRRPRRFRAGSIGTLRRVDDAGTNPGGGPACGALTRCARPGCCVPGGPGDGGLYDEPQGPSPQAICPPSGSTTRRLRMRGSARRRGETHLDARRLRRGSVSWRRGSRRRRRLSTCGLASGERRDSGSSR